MSDKNLHTALVEVEEKYQKKSCYMGDSDGTVTYLVCQGLKQLKTKLNLIYN